MFVNRELPKRKALAASIASLLAATTATPALAQSVLEEIVVTAQKRAESIMDVPVAVSVTTAEQIKRDQIYTLGDLQRTTPALEVSQTFGGEQSGGGRIRGIGTAIQNNTSAASVAIVIDDMPAGNTTFNGIFDIAQVEVLRGPQGTLFGQTASAGVINITTAKPNVDEFEASIGLDWSDKDTGGSEFGQQVYRGVLNVPVTENSAIRLAGYMVAESGLQENVFLGEDNEEDLTQVRLKYLVSPSDRFTAELTVEQSEKDVSGRNFFAIAKPANQNISPAPGVVIPPQAVIGAYLAPTCGVSEIEDRAGEYCSNQMDDITRTITAFSAVLDWDFGNDHSLKSLTSYRELDQDLVIQEYSRLIPPPVASDRDQNLDGEQFSQEFRLSSNFDGAFNYIAGVYYSDYSYEVTPMSTNFGDPTDPVGFSVCNADGSFCPVPPFFTRQDGSVTSLAVYGDLTYDFSDSLRLFGGLRFTDYEVEAATGINGPITNSFSSDESNVSGRVGFQMDVGESGMFYGTFSRGFKGQVIDVPPAPTLETTVLDPEISLSYELGYKVGLGDSTELEANIFWTDIEDFQAQRSVFVGTALVSVLEGIDLEAKGIEVLVRGLVGDSFSYNAGYIYNDTPYPSGFLGADGGSLAGDQFVNSPEHKFTLSGEYFHPFGNNELFVNFNTYWKSDVRYEARSQDTFVYGAHANIGGSVGLRSQDGKWSVSLFGRNITGEDEPISYLASTFAGQVDGGVRAWPAGGVTARQVGIGLDFNF